MDLPQNILSQKKLHLDYKVWLVMLVVAFLCLGLISYHKINDSKGCAPFTLSVKSLINSSSNNIYTVGETLVFKTSLPNSEKITWQFGDDSKRETFQNMNLRHQFRSAGTFTVTASIGRTCSNELTVHIKKPLNTDLPKNTEVSKFHIYGDKEPKTGKKIYYYSDAKGNSFEWKILDKVTFPIITTKDAKFSFPESGIYVLQLTIDHDSKKRSEIEITVSEDFPQIKKPKIEPLIVFKPHKKHNNDPIIIPTPQPIENASLAITPKKIVVAKDIFLNKLIGVVKGSNDVHDFDDYLLDGENTKVFVNDEKSIKTFKELCNDIKGKKRIEIESVEFTKVKNDQIQQLKVNYKKKGILGL